MARAQHGTEPTLVVLVDYILPPATKGLILAAPWPAWSIEHDWERWQWNALGHYKGKPEAVGRKEARPSSRTEVFPPPGQVLHALLLHRWRSPRCPPVASQGSHQQRNTSTSSRHTALATARCTWPGICSCTAGGRFQGVVVCFLFFLFC